ncbi:hypothetical protein BJ166DRAFT_543310 [Pestalotiopsis sp. NC0098]|nr:hypothetical protein BJ166DRAFT_543310 [Pestalotiopsis sp. NC0098]
MRVTVSLHCHILFYLAVYLRVTQSLSNSASQYPSGQCLRVRTLVGSYTAEIMTTHSEVAGISIKRNCHLAWLLVTKCIFL